ncbi:MAG: VWA domain-containing protein [Deltaproteobacteria bacterium]|nr:VWA domain-containing protein [Deltaproteobacteria bacterium]MBN2674828.1 VWA domain-containing protein [Deltaproteobacteria bacterium]
MKKCNWSHLFSLLCISSAVSVACADVDDASMYASPDDADRTTAGIGTDTDPVITTQDTTGEIVETPVEWQAVGDECIVPDRDEFMANYGVTMDDDDLSDPNVVAAKRHTILFIFDKSGSMQSAWNEDGGSKWDIAKDAMIASVEPFQTYLSAGALFFPLYYGGVEVAPIDSGLQINYSIGSAFMSTWEQNMEIYAADGGTPLMVALEAANDAIAYACDLNLMTQPFKVVLLTDGMPDYWDAQRGLTLIKSWYDMGIPTTVMGMPGSQSAAQLLADIADVGSGGEVDLSTGTVTSEGDADEIIYTNESTYEDFESDLTIAAE